MKSKKAWIRIAESSLKKTSEKGQSLSLNGKRGWIRIAEAFIAVVLIAAIVLSVYVRQPPRTSNEVIIQVESSLLNEIVQREDLREAVLSNNTLKIENFIRDRAPGNLDFAIKICPPEEICSIDGYRKEVYASDRIIASTLHEYNPKKLKIFMWEK